MTQDQAKAAAIADGIAEVDCTPEVLAEYGFVAPDPLAGVTVNPPALDDATVAADTAAGQAEAKANQLPNQILQGAKDVAGVVLPAVKGAAL